MAEELHMTIKCAQYLAGYCAEFNAEKTYINVDGLTNDEGLPLGDWVVTIERRANPQPTKGE